MLLKWRMCRNAKAEMQGVCACVAVCVCVGGAGKYEKVTKTKINPNRLSETAFTTLRI